MIYVIRNDEVEQVLIGVPKGHKHLRICLKLKQNRTLIFQEATVANIVRAYITVKTHPTIGALKLESRILPKSEIKNGYADCQLLEVEEEEGEIREEITRLLESAQLF